MAPRDARNNRRKQRNQTAMALSFWIVVAGVFGAMFGSFLNVVIYRMPRGRSVAAGRSQCPQCRETIRWFDNIPVVSWILLCGRCRRCGWRIPKRYPIVEVLSAVGAVLCV